MKAALSFYEDTLSACLDKAMEKFTSEGVEFAEESPFRPFYYGGIPYNTDKVGHEEIKQIKGKGTRKYAHLTIWRDRHGIYEWNAYVA